MFRKLLCTLVLLFLFVGFAAADEIRAFITKVDPDGKTVTFSEYNPKGEKDGRKKTLPADIDRVFWGRFNPANMKLDPTSKIDGGLKNEVFRGIDSSNKRGLTAFIITDGENRRVKEIRVYSPDKK